MFHPDSPMTTRTQLDIGEQSFQERPELERHLALESFIALARESRACFGDGLQSATP